MGKSVNICPCHVSLGILFFLPKTIIPQGLIDFRINSIQYINRALNWNLENSSPIETMLCMLTQLLG